MELINVPVFSSFLQHELECSIKFIRDLTFKDGFRDRIFNDADFF